MKFPLTAFAALATATVAAIAPAATAQDRTFITEAPSADDYVELLFVETENQRPEIKTRGIKTRGIQITAPSLPQPSQIAVQAASQVASSVTRPGPAQPAPVATASPVPSQAAPVPAPSVTQVSAPSSATIASAPSPTVQPATAAPAPAAPRILAAPVNFNLDSAAIPADFEPYLVNLAEAMKRPEAAGKLLIVTGHTDSIGSAEYNLKLSMQRADSVQVFLIDNGVKPSQIIAAGRGERDLISGREHEHDLNRRVEFKVTG